jgi:hypothetical protein
MRVPSRRVPYRRALIAALCALPFLGCLWFFGTLLVFDVAGGDFSRYGAPGQSAAPWAVPAWLAFTGALVAADVLAARYVYRRAAIRVRG